MKIKILPYESCVRIGKQMFENDCTCGLPPDIFDRTFEVMEMLYDEETNFYHIAENTEILVDGRKIEVLGLDWWIPVIFVSYTIC